MAKRKDSFLTRRATFNDKLKAIKAGFRGLSERWYRVIDTDVSTPDGIRLTGNPGEPYSINWPLKPKVSASKALDRMLRYCRSRKTTRIGCGFLHQPVPRDLPAMLVGRGFRWLASPNKFMWLDCRTMDCSFVLPDGVSVDIPTEMPTVKAEGLPFYKADNLNVLRLLVRKRPQRVFYFTIWEAGKLIGHSTLHINPGRYGIGTLHDVGVVPETRGRGIGTAMVSEVCRFAEQMGCRYVATNASKMGQPVYGRVGFEVFCDVAHYYMWPAVVDHPFTKSEIAFVEAVGRGDLGYLKKVRDKKKFTTLLRSGVTPLDVAVKIARSYEACEFLLEMGASPDGVDGAKCTPLILAVDENLPDVVALLLEQGAKVDRKDADGRDAMGLATERGYKEMIALLKRYL